MHIHDTSSLTHNHSYISDKTHRNERKTRIVVVITLVMMVAEIICGQWFNSMALLADGWHMSTHAVALGIAAFAYIISRREANNPLFSFGTGKIGSLGGFTSAIILAAVALVVTVESLERLYHPTPIIFNEAIAVAVLGLLVNLVSAWLLMDNDHHHSHAHEHNHHHSHGHHHHDHNMRAAYLHVLADAVTSVLAIIALVCGKYFGLNWLDPFIGLVGSMVILSWAWGLIRQTSHILLDHTPDKDLESAIRRSIEHHDDNQVTDLHLWCIAPGKYSAIISLVTHTPQSPKHYKSLLADFYLLDHITIEVNQCEAHLNNTIHVTQ